MKVIDYSPFLDERGEVPLTERIRGTLRYGSSWYTDIQAQDTVIRHLQSALDDSFILLRNHTLPGLDVPIPLVLVGPVGLQVIYATGTKGIFQAKDDEWLAMAANSRQFRPTRPNLINRALLLSRALERHLRRCGFEVEDIEPVLVFTDPGVHVDTKGPAARIVMIDALDRYAANLGNAEERFTAETVDKVVGLLTNPPPLPDIAEGEEGDEDRMLQQAFGMRTYSHPSGNSTEVMVPYVGPVRFTNRQWLILGILVVVNVIVLTGFILIAISLA